MPSKSRIKAVAAGILLTMAAGCGPRFSAEPTVDAYQSSGPGQKIEVEAYLYDVRVRRDGKPTSLRLELFQTDSVIAMGGRGYLGKGALKGRLTGDSVEVYFPTRHEYLYEAVRDLLFRSSCTHGIPQLDFPGLLTKLPDQQTFGDDLVVRLEDKDNNHPRFYLTWTDCAWQMEVAYNRRADGWRLQEVRFDDGDKLTFKASRRAHKTSTRVSRRRFELPAEPGYVRITP